MLSLEVGRKREVTGRRACLRVVAILPCRRRAIIHLAAVLVVAPVDQHHRDGDVHALVRAVRTRVTVHAAVRVPHTFAIAHIAGVTIGVQVLLDIATDLAVARRDLRDLREPAVER